MGKGEEKNTAHDGAVSVAWSVKGMTKRVGRRKILAVIKTQSWCSSPPSVPSAVQMPAPGTPARPGTA